MSSLNEVAILNILAKQEISFSNGLLFEVAIFMKLVKHPPACAFIRARIGVAIGLPRFIAGVPAQ